MKEALLLCIVLQLLIFSYANPLRIIGGTDAEDGSVPYQVSIRSSIDEHFCGGSIISHRSILTSAGCVRGKTNDEILIVVGTNSLKTGGTKYSVSNIKIHPAFNPSVIFNDIAILEVVEDIVFNSNVQPIELDSLDIEGNRTVTLTGWGESNTRLNNPRLQTIDLETITVYECQGYMVHFGWINKDQLCTYANIGEGSCLGDYGGPVTLNGKLVGVSSWSVSCGKGHPDVHSRIASFAQWIEDNIV